MLALAYLLAAFIGAPALAVVTILAALAACGTVLARRPSQALRLGLVTVGVWLAVSFAGAFALSRRPIAGLTWALLVVYVLPLPLVPFIYARTFPHENGTVNPDVTPTIRERPETS